MSDALTRLALSPRRRLLAWIGSALSRRAENEVMQRSLRRLAEYDDRLLDDIGMTREQALRCARKAPSDASEWWNTTRIH